ncbi:MAG: sugar phosphate nucleotidyltransferase [Candidatus Omnitrophica bacterium]|nr:sugar phosphate nucleotidyltransferase [Candidatus Omnitrophota bacterium]
MQVVILAGGKGTRLRPITKQVPKSMVLISGKPFLQHQLEFSRSLGLSKFLFLIGYLGGQIKKYFGDGSKFGVEINYSCEEKLLGTAGALKNARHKLDKEFLLLNGDTFLPMDYNKLIKYFKQSGSIGVVSAYNNLEKTVQNNIAIDKSNRIVNYNKKDSKGMAYVDSGAMVFKKEILGFIPGAQFCSLEEEVFDKLIKKRELMAFVNNQRFYDMGSFKGLELLKDKLK